MDISGINVEALNSGLKAVKALRSTVLEVFTALGDGAVDASTDEEREKFINELQGTLNNVTVRMRELETACTLLGSPNHPLYLGNSGLLSQDPAFEKTPLYSQLVQAHRWFDRVAELSSHAASLLNVNSIKRTHFSPVTPSKTAKTKPTGVNIPVQTVDQTTSQLSRLFPDLAVQVLKPFGSSTVILVSVPRTLKAVLMLRGLIIDWVLVKGFDEEFYDEEKGLPRPGKNYMLHLPEIRPNFLCSSPLQPQYGQLDMFTPSRYHVFRKVTEHANAAMLHFYSPNIPELAVRSFLTWLRSYANLFTAPCRKCGNRLNENMPPTWRDLRNLDVYHESCRP
ncbi:hypothetical protein JTE90_007350 [Oedothorax gibbosus]|uniref:Mediator of RNA polymerase II transcription subunit 27 n=1 Tax=Oedothorax gibbosus TaxID=931172 RepID=A0AAV6TT20_9ARAC|nr:hypothetical protein JTE90_007350 [Oedothorax gibbosus]